ncbi:MAG: hypothetical protein DWQ07_23285 [Chloroflexi bacterium]|nr:MAG: hypothetical protein DWQ07_23285 [Chloroflexota bacterium]MBL1194074.1 hypothetical protein [Chloroflexota bacterium]NOH11368.1 hypothetical protein [Chloroflexota bacterium]
MNFEEFLPWISGALGVPVINWLKTQFGFAGKAAMWLTLAVSVAVSLSALLLTQQISFMDFSVENVLNIFGQVVAAATIVYKLLIEPAAPPIEEQ